MGNQSSKNTCIKYTGNLQIEFPKQVGYVDFISILNKLIEITDTTPNDTELGHKIRNFFKIAQ